MAELGNTFESSPKQHQDSSTKKESVTIQPQIQCKAPDWLLSSVSDNDEKDALRLLFMKLDPKLGNCLVDGDKKIIADFFDEMNGGKSPSEYLKDPKKAEDAIREQFAGSLKEQTATIKEQNTATEKQEKFKSVFELFDAHKDIKLRFAEKLSAWENNKLPEPEQKKLVKDVLDYLQKDAFEKIKVASSPTATPEQKQAAEQAKNTLSNFATEFYQAWLVSLAELEQYKQGFPKLEDLKASGKIEANVAETLPKDSVKLSPDASGKEQFVAFGKREGEERVPLDSLISIDKEKKQVSEKLISGDTGYSISIDYPLDTKAEKLDLEKQKERSERSKNTLNSYIKDYEELDRLHNDSEVQESLPKDEEGQKQDRKNILTKKNPTELEKKRAKYYELSEKKKELVKHGAPDSPKALAEYSASVEKQIADLSDKLNALSKTPQNDQKDTLKKNARNVIEFMDSIGLSHLGEKNADEILSQISKKLSSREGKAGLQLTNTNPPKIDANSPLTKEDSDRIQKLFAELIGEPSPFDTKTNPPTLKKLDESGKTINYSTEWKKRGILKEDGSLGKQIFGNEKAK